MNATTMPPRTIAGRLELRRARTAVRARRRGSAGAGRRRSADAAGQRDRAWAGALVDGHRQSPGAKRKRGARGSRKASGSDGRGRAPLVELERGGVVMGRRARAARAPRAGGDRTTCGGWTGDACSSGAPPCRIRWCRAGRAHAASRSAARSRALRARGLAAILGRVGVSDGRVRRRRRGFRPQTQTGSSGGQTQPRRSAARKRLTMRSSREW